MVAGSGKESHKRETPQSQFQNLMNNVPTPRLRRLRRWWLPPPLVLNPNPASSWVNVVNPANNTTIDFYVLKIPNRQVC
ncbi:hypothetical protein MKW98_010012 [Papaver atlanticum]|uniref:Uncharacterized protein n=1 Tax=Papaver atlanticum TaxID=357466 RepID=A0AAD4RXL6_9MAGN|nr:hypothetical protein MKW98_010012 [Papaver atlanticum]